MAAAAFTTAAATVLPASSFGMRWLGPATLIAATTSPLWFLIGAATQQTPFSRSSSSSPYPRSRITRSSLSRRFAVVIVRGVIAGNRCVAAHAATSSSGMNARMSCPGRCSTPAGSRRHVCA